MRAVKERRKLRGSKVSKPNAGDDTYVSAIMVVPKNLMTINASVCRVRVIVRVRPLLRDEKKVCKAVVHVKSETSLQVLNSAHAF